MRDVNSSGVGPVKTFTSDERHQIDTCTSTLTSLYSVTFHNTNGSSSKLCTNVTIIGKGDQ